MRLVRVRSDLLHSRTGPSSLQLNIHLFLRLLAAAQRIIDEDEDDEDLKLLFAPGSSLGGARPKASVRDNDGSLAIAKFPHKEDEWRVVAWEATALAC
jgi:serine/threonine-protein kinase HipA